MAPLTWYHVTQRNIKLIIDRIIKQKRGICGMLSLTHSLTHTHTFYTVLLSHTSIVYSSCQTGMCRSVVHVI